MAASLTEAVMLVAKICLLVVAWACLVVFMAWQVASMVASWSWLYWKNTVWEQLRHELVIKSGLVPDDGGYLGGWDNLYLVFMGLTTVIAAVCISAATLVPRGALLDKAAAKAQAAWAPVRRVLNWQVPGRRFWLRWCAGLSFAEAALWLSWFAVHLIGVVDMTIYFGRKYEGWEQLGMRMHVPHSVQVLADISIAFSWVIYIDTALVFYPISHNTFLNRMLGIPYAGLIRFHRWLGHFLFWSVAGHGIFFYLYWFADPTINFWDAFFDWRTLYHIPSFAGTIAFVFAIVLVITSMECIRRRYFNFFYRSHIICFLGFTIFAFVHYYWSWVGFFPGLFLYGADLVMRSYYSHKGAWITVLQPSSDGSLVHVKVAVAPKTFKEPKRLLGAHVFLRIPALSHLDWHPFTIADVAVDGGGVTVLTVIVKAYDHWTKRLCELAGAAAAKGGKAGVDLSALRVNIWRPFDEMDFDWHAYGEVLVVAGGIAVTPVVAMLRQALANADGAAAAAATRPRMRVVFVARTPAEFSALGGDIINASREHDWLDLQLHFTGRPADAEGTLPDTKSVSKDVQDVPPLEHVASASSSTGTGAASPRPDGGSLPSDMDDRASSAPPTRFAAMWSLISRCTPVDFMSDAQMVWVVLLAFFGGFMGLILSQAMYLELYANDDYYVGVFAVVGLCYALIISIQCVGLPAAFVVLPAMIKRIAARWRGIPPWKAALNAALSAPVDPPVGLDAAGNLTCWGSAESGITVPVTCGRPDLNAEVAALASRARGLPGARAAVFVAGPTAMIHAVSLAVSGINGAPLCNSSLELELFKAAFEF